MQYYLCPRCKFKTAAKKHVCQTCGLNFAVARSTNGGDNKTDSEKPSKIKAWSKLLGLDGHRTKESGHEKPALG